MRISDWSSDVCSSDLKKIDEAAKAWEGSPYPVIFNTADAIIVQGNKLLMVKRRGYPGKGLWALPGGFLNHRERVIEAAIREATEETGIDVSKTVLRNALVDTFFERSEERRVGKECVGTCSSRGSRYD